MLQRVYNRLGTVCFVLNIFFIAAVQCRYLLGVPYEILEWAIICFYLFYLLVPYMIAFLLFYGTWAILHGNRDAWRPMIIGVVPTILSIVGALSIKILY